MRRELGVLVLRFATWFFRWKKAIAAELSCLPEGFEAIVSENSSFSCFKRVRFLRFIRRGGQRFCRHSWH